ncbi:pantoate--beta-alanine ligase [Clostridium aminobutyricum]|uniref:Pantothenate synthetase n=1 Tax=Clostridium aminobutyricum TaxID=33953 RepID=A0A939DAK8_CLOAM|nr:pantoate--beta-alanine ligase [Clostridium aminobutyricum]MBN7774180.1 pantoate--beta-alanine ligase [Clostridium aminobutyricum]
MKTVSTIQEVREIVKKWRQENCSIGFVPTMGYLHEGHESLMKAAKANHDKVVVSIFVNPMQFGKNEDLDTYPRDMEHDSAVCEAIGVDVIFHPSPSEMYGENFYTYVDMDYLTEGLCGKSRPVMFRGVCTVVSKLFNIVQPDKAYFGQKDAQQLAVITRMVKDLNFDLEIVGCPIVREEDGLAKSSRNSYLNADERKAALVLHHALTIAQNLIESGETNALLIKEKMIQEIKKEPLARIDYVEIVDWENIKAIEQIHKSALIALAVFIGKTRLIDNFIHIIK